ncbi:MAG TPA: ATPase, T2SS/T4P/T4SS family [Polyangiales bacterium]|nr:ATPase, T2SS/T4P/T4SS family [Polyangiales bacterium]
MTQLAQYVTKLDSVGASELLLGAGHPPLYRSASGLLPLPGETPLVGSELLKLVEAWLGPERWTHLHTHRALSCVLGLGPHPRLRVRCSLSQQGATLQLRVLDSPLTLAELQLPAQLAVLGDLNAGLVIVTGRHGSGKTNALAALLQLMAERRRRHIVSLENPVELLHHSRISSVSQRELGNHFPSFAVGVRSALSANADVILLAKPEDDELCEVAARAANNAVVLGEVRGRGCIPVLERLMAMAASKGDAAGFAENFAAIISLELIPKKGGSRVPACEVVLQSPALKAALREAKPGGIAKLPAPSFGQGSQTLEAGKLELLRQGLIDTH